MRIAFDGTTLRPGRTGVGYYTEHLLQHLALETGGNEVIVVSNRAIETSAPLPPEVQVARNYVFPLRLPWMQFVAPRMLDELDADVAHFTNSMVPLASPIPTVVTIHDMSLTLYPQYHPVRRVLLNRPLVNLAARRVDAIITVSHSARRDILRLYNVPPDRVRVVHEAAAPAFQPISDAARLDDVRRRYGLPARFILYVGTIEPRKNLPRLLDAFARRRRCGDLSHTLVCVGRYGWRARDVERAVERLGLAGTIRFLGYVPHADLPALYNLAETFVFPSLHEGFGLPVMEAMACGVPVVVGRNSSLVEIAGDAAETVDATDVDAIGAALVRLARDRDGRLERGRRGLARARAFSWRHAARETLDVYHWVADRAGTAPVLEPRPAAVGGLGFDDLAGRHATAEQQAPWT
jgi:glycosyltransferase involved in cell wall biosynthesis